MNFAYLILGSNIGDSLEILQSAVMAIETEVGDVAAKSDYYFTKAWGNTNQPDFINQVVKVETDLLPKELLEKILLIEKKAGRIRGEVKWQQRTLDIDIFSLIIVEATRSRTDIPITVAIKIEKAILVSKTLRLRDFLIFNLLINISKS